MRKKNEQDAYHKQQHEAIVKRLAFCELRSTRKLQC